MRAKPLAQQGVRRTTVRPDGVRRVGRAAGVIAGVLVAAVAATLVASGAGPAGAVAAGAAVTVDLDGPAAAADAGPLADPESAPFLDGAPAPGASAGSGPLSAGASATVGPQPVPPTPRGLPAGLEGLQPYVPAVSCDPRDTVGTAALGRLLTATYPGTSAGIARTCGTDPLRTSEHYEGRALDWMTSVRDPLGAARARAMLGWLLGTDAAGNRYAAARRLGVMYVIWDNRIWGAYNPAAGWRPYSRCALHPEPAWDTTCHRDHVHISLGWAGARARTSYWTGAVAPSDFGPCRPVDLNWADPYTSQRATRCPTYPLVVAPQGSSARLRQLTTFSGMRLVRGMTGPVVTAVQKIVGASPDGEYGPLTAASVRSFQTAHAVSVSGVVDAPTWRTVLAVVRSQDAAAPPTSSPTPTPTPTPMPTPTPTPTAPTPTAPTPTAPTPTAPTPSPTATPTPRPTATPTRPAAQRPVLRLGSRGIWVRRAQAALGVPVDGRFGPQTRRAVLGFQRRHRLPVTGVVGPLTWRALGV
jgi:peptidoglycan hydrolase-like protein with peptidoglycan-binding domain